MASKTDTFEGGCTCRHVRYRMTSRPLFVHCCHCRWCQRETGAAFALNAMIEADRVELLERRARAGRHAVGQRQGPEDLALPDVPRRAVEQLRAAPATRCASCASARSTSPTAMPPDIHIFTSSKQPWVVLPAGTPAVRRVLQAASEMWPKESLERRAALKRRKSRLRSATRAATLRAPRLTIRMSLSTRRYWWPAGDGESLAISAAGSASPVTPSGSGWSSFQTCFAGGRRADRRCSSSPGPPGNGRRRPLRDSRHRRRYGRAPARPC